MRDHATREQLLVLANLGLLIRIHYHKPDIPGGADSYSAAPSH
jgi:hypothetical protein